jgi:hypothetical protein
MVSCACVRVRARACVFVHVCLNFTNSFFGYIKYISPYHTVVQFDM